MMIVTPLRWEAKKFGGIGTQLYETVRRTLDVIREITKLPE